MKTRIFSLLTLLCIVLSFIPVSAEEAPEITINTESNAEQAIITITGQLQETIEQTKGQGRWLLKVYARVSTKVELSYQWYSNTIKDNTSGTPIPGATKDIFEIPTDLEGGVYYYYCKLSAPGAEPVCTNVTTVTVKVKIARQAPPPPILNTITPTSITLLDDPNLEYSLDGKRWYGATFTGLTPDTTYYVYARYMGYYNIEPSPASEPLVVKTPKRYEDKGLQEAPTLELLHKTGTSVTLKPIEGAEYRCLGLPWQDSNTFYNLYPSNKYTFYARMKETDDLQHSPESSPLTVTTNESGGFPFVPSNKNMTNGIIKSGWAYIYSRDNGSIAVDKDGFLHPSRSGYSPFYFEHLGDNTYYIRAADGGFLSYHGSIKKGSAIIISEMACEWKIYSENAGGYVQYNFCLARNTSYLLSLFGGDGYETLDTIVMLTSNNSKFFHRDGGQLRISTIDPRSSHILPKWWTEYLDGKLEPSDIVKTITYEGVIREKTEKPLEPYVNTSPKDEETSPEKVETVTANPSNTKFVMNGKPISVTAAYNIDGSNYLQLRAIAAMLKGTAAQFDVSWDGQYAVIEPGKPYSGTVTETKLQSTTNVIYSNTKFKMNGEVFTFYDARLIDGSTNYIQLREFAQKLSGTASQFDVYWDSKAGQAVIQPGEPYTGEEPADDSYEDDPYEDVNASNEKKEFYYIKASKNENFVVEVSGASEKDGAKLNLHTRTGNDNQKFRLIKADVDVYVIQCVHSGKWWTSSGKKGSVITQSTSVPDGSSITFTLIKQANGTYKIMDYASGLYVGVSEAKLENGTNIILGTEASDGSQTFILERIE